MKRKCPLCDLRMDDWPGGSLFEHFGTAHCPTWLGPTHNTRFFKCVCRADFALDYEKDQFWGHVKQDGGTLLRHCLLHGLGVSDQGGSNGGGDG